MAKGENCIYVKDNNNIVYKKLENHLLKLSPWQEGEDRRVSISDIDGYTIITYKNACMIVNNQFNNTIEKWTHNGKRFIANAIGTNKNIDEYSYLLSTLPNHTITISSNDNSTELKMIKHKGKIYYMLMIDKFLPRVQMFNLFGEFCQWAKVTDCKPIFCQDDKTYV